MQETWVGPLAWEDTLKKGMATHSSILAWEIPWTEEPGRLQSMGLWKRQTWLNNNRPGLMIEGKNKKRANSVISNCRWDNHTGRKSQIIKTTIQQISCFFILVSIIKKNNNIHWACLKFSTLNMQRRKYNWNQNNMKEVKGLNKRCSSPFWLQNCLNRYLAWKIQTCKNCLLSELTYIELVYSK